MPGAPNGMLGFGLLYVLVIVGIVVYFVPTWVASRRNHKNLLGILLVNVFLGWTIVGWVVALVWALHRAPHYLRRS